MERGEGNKPNERNNENMGGYSKPTTRTKKQIANSKKEKKSKPQERAKLLSPIQVQVQVSKSEADDLNMYHICHVPIIPYASSRLDIEPNPRAMCVCADSKIRTPRQIIPRLEVALWICVWFFFFGWLPSFVYCLSVGGRGMSFVQVEWNDNEPTGKTTRKEGEE
jgi:hypothetical protein